LRSLNVVAASRPGTNSMKVATLTSAYVDLNLP
jgi:hypothetical protein